ncbi:MAG: PfkB family carbohydrate kinase [Bacteroidales bacterium]|nr:PfkB family carbohydrate kinase [Bacteroidales bacterium]
MERRIFGIGETVLDIVFKCGQPVAAVPGGSTFNAMVSLGRTLGKKFPEVDVTMITQMGRDKVSDIILGFMKENNLRTDQVESVEGVQSPVSMAMLDENNDATYEFFRDHKAPEFKAGDLDFGPGDIILFGSFFAISKATGDETRKLVRKAREAGATVYYDINFRKSHLLDLPQTIGAIEENCTLSDIVRASAEDIGYIYGSSDAQEVYEKHISKLCGTFICTRGADAIEVFSAGRRDVFEIEKVTTVSTIGAGDNFNAGTIYSLVRDGIFREQASCISPEQWGRIVPTATRFSQAVCQSMFNYVDPDFADNEL